MSKKTLKDMDRREKIFVTGQYLGVIEEFLPDKQSTFVKEGKIFATKTGLVDLNNEDKKLKIRTLQESNRKVVKIGDFVIGNILFLRQYSVGITFFTINRKVHFNSGYFGNVHVSQISNSYVEKIHDAFQITDIVRARVIEQNYNEYKLSTTGSNLGVIFADCVICGNSLTKIGFNKLRCERCGNIETRKLSDDYGDVKKTLRF